MDSVEQLSFSSEADGIAHPTSGVLPTRYQLCGDHTVLRHMDCQSADPSVEPTTRGGARNTKFRAGLAVFGYGNGTPNHPASIDELKR